VGCLSQLPSCSQRADAAELAFRTLRADVAGLGRRLDALVRQSEQGVGASAPHYSPTLGAMAKELRGRRPNWTASRRIQR